MALTVYFPSKGAGKVFDGDGLKIRPVKFDFGVYATNGVAVTAADVKMEQIDAIIFEMSDNSGVKTCFWDKSAGKILCYTAIYATEVSGSTDLTGQTVWGLVIGR